MESNSAPRIKLKLNAKPVAVKPEPAPSPATTGTPKLKIKLGSKSGPSTPAVATPTTSTPAQKPKNKIKLITKDPGSSSKKRARDEHPKESKTSKEKAGPAASSHKRIKLTAKPIPSKAVGAPHLRLKHKGKPPVRPLGVGYDSEASDREEDPAIEEEFILRMEPGDDCDYLRKAIEERKFGSLREGGADVQMKFLSKDGRRAVVTIRGRMYAASLVDLPCIIEGMKSWDKRGWYKTADISQMLLVLGIVKTEEEARHFPLPNEVDTKTWQYAHGLTPPMHWARKRRFRARVSHRAIEEVEQEVARLLQRDAEAIEAPLWENIDHQRLTREASMHHSDGLHASSEYDDEQDAEGEADDPMYDDTAQIGYFDNANGGAGGNDFQDDDLAADLEAAFAEDPNDGDVGDTATPAVADTPQYFEHDIDTTSMAASPADVSTPFTKATSGDESSDGDDDDDDAGSIDEEALEQQQNLQQQREEIADIEAAIEQETARWEAQTNLILKKKMYNKIQSLREDLDMKRSAIGEGDD